ncbi:MAG: imelysin family protein [Nannocystaceae bacterium]
MPGLAGLPTHPSSGPVDPLSGPAGARDAGASGAATTRGIPLLPASVRGVAAVTVGALTLPALTVGALSLFGCSGDGDPTSPWDDAAFKAQATEVVDGYAAHVQGRYAETRADAEALQAAVDGFLAAPSEAGLKSARDAWLAARTPYGTTEVFRFYGGPIDGEPDNLEGQINSWPLDEAYIDYVDGAEMSGIINDPATYPTIDAATLIAANGALGEDTISTGWHAIEFLLWGQDFDPAGPGDRPYTDFVDGPEGTATNQERRRTYLKVVTDLLVEDLRAVEVAWAADQDDYRRTFVGDDPRESLTKVLLGMGSLSGAELAGERMTVAYETREQEDEHSCFSDNTHMDLWANAKGIQEVYVGDGGASLSALVRSRDPEVDQRLTAALEASVSAIAAIPPPFDAAIQAADGSPEREAVKAAIDALKEQTAAIAEAATLLEITLNLEE